jgi:hypothetical protein
MSDLVELEHAALAGQVVNMQLQRDSETQPSDNQRKLIMKAKADIQQEMLRTNTFKSGYLIWLNCCLNEYKNISLIALQKNICLLSKRSKS